MAAGSRPAAAPGGAAAPARRLYLDNLRVVLVAAIIAAHGVVGYVGLEEVWAYNGVQEVTLSAATTVLIFAFAVPFAFFLIALLFLVAGLLTPESVARKGPGRFAVDRLLRLGVPFAVFTLLLWPALLYALYRPLGRTTLSYWAEFTANYPENGPLWFVGVLLLLSLGYAGWCRLRRGRPRWSPVISPRRLVVLALAIGVATFPIRLVYPLGSQDFADLNSWQWPECVGLFVLGTLAAGQGWLAAVPDRLWRPARRATLLTAAVLAVTVAVTAPFGVPLEDFAGGRHAPALVLALAEGFLTVFGPIWLLSVAQRRLDRPFPHGTALARSSYAAFLVQGVFLLGLAVALRPVPVVAEAKALVVAVGGVAGSFAAAWLLVSRVPALRRVL